MRKLLPVLLAVLGIGGGIGAGLLFAPARSEHEASADCLPSDVAPGHTADVPSPEPAEPGSQNRDYVKMNNQFVVPLVANERVSSLVVLSLSLEVESGATEAVYRVEPKLRDGFLQVLFDHAHIGGFQGSFTQAKNMTLLRRALLETARKTVGGSVKDVLITEIVRQDA